MIDTAKDSVVATVSVGIGPHCVAVTPDGSRVYVANYGSNTVSVIATASNSVVDTVSVGNGPEGLSIVPPPILTVNKAGTGSGTVTSLPSGINCGPTCSAGFTGGPTVALTATPDSSSTFASWSGCDSVAGNKCSVAMNVSRSVTATFNSTVNKGDVNGDGQINVTDARICLQIALGFIQPTDKQKQACDVNGDGQVTLADAQEIARFAIGQIGSLPAFISSSGVLAFTLPMLLLGLVGFVRKRRNSAMKWLRKRVIFILPLLMGVGLLLTACSSGVTTSVLVFSHTSLAQTGYGTLTLGVAGMPDGGLASIEIKNGGMSFDPSLFIVTGIKGLHGFTVLASVIDNSAGKVSFAAVNPSGGTTTGSVIEFSLAQKGIGSSTVKIDTSKLVLGDANNIAIPTGSVTVRSETISIP